ncbi:MAG: tyrosine-type recombinase/integrase [Actinomycetota bacterium]|nr:tyrosine-type recombinase/integrase [Actinomycetota bacterium]
MAKHDLHRSVLLLLEDLISVGNLITVDGLGQPSPITPSTARSAGPSRASHHSSSSGPTEAGVQSSPRPARLHDLRHSAATAMLTSDLDLRMTGAVLGHSQIAQTARYSHVVAGR